MSTGVLGVPVTALLVGSVVWNVNLAGTIVTGTMAQLVATLMPELMIVANAVTALPTCTERLDGSTAATSALALGAGGPAIFCNAISKSGR